MGYFLSFIFLCRLFKIFHQQLPDRQDGWLQFPVTSATLSCQDYAFAACSLIGLNLLNGLNNASNECFILMQWKIVLWDEEWNVLSFLFSQCFPLYEYGTIIVLLQLYKSYFRVLPDLTYITNTECSVCSPDACEKTMQAITWVGLKPATYCFLVQTS